jgi:hypothetical protein
MQAVAACADAALEASGCARRGSLGAGCAVCAGADCGACDAAEDAVVGWIGTGGDVVIVPGMLCRAGADCEFGLER